MILPLSLIVTAIAASAATGVIEGALGYPGEKIPGDMKVCAENLVTKHVFATTASLKGHRAYYSEFVTCGLRVSCPSHAPIVVTVLAGQMVSAVDPHDWYK